MTSLRTSLALLAFCLPLGSDRLVLEPEEDTEVSRRFEARARFELVGLTYTTNGEEFEEENLPDFSIDSLETIAVTDAFESVADGRPAVFTRTFDELAQRSEYDFGDETEESESKSDLEGRRVRFEWDEDGEFYDVTADDDEDLEDHVSEWLLPDLDMRDLLPEDEVEPGDEWDAEPRAYLVVMWPGGLLDFYEEDEEDEAPGYERRMNEQVIENLDGEGTVTFEEIREEDDVRVAVLRLELDLETEGEATETVTREFLDEDGDTIDVEIEIRHAVELRRQIEGVVLWNLEGNHLHSLRLEAEIEMDSHTDQTAEGPNGEEFQLRRTNTFEGTIEYRGEVE